MPDIQQQSAYGSNNIQPIQVGDQVFYVSPDGRKVRAMQYEWSADNWLSQDLTFFSEQITESGIKNMCWMPNPNNILMLTLNNGTVAALTYQRDQNVWGWARASVYGDIVSSASPRRLGENEYMFLSRHVEGKLTLAYQATEEDGYVDAYVYQSNTEPFTVVTGLDHLEGQRVQVLVDDIYGSTNRVLANSVDKANPSLAVHPDRVVEGGQITLQGEHTKAIAGLQFIPILRTLDLATMGPEGSSLTDLKHLSSIYVGVLDTYGITINGQRPPDRNSVTPMNFREPNKTEIIEVTDIDWTQGGTVEIRQELPLPVQILYIGTKADIEEP